LSACHKIGMRFVFHSKDCDQPHGKESIMLSKPEVTGSKRATPKRMRVAAFAAVLAATLAGVYTYVAPASDAARAPLDDRPGIATNATITPWGDPTAGAVDSAGIETDLDGNASALFPSDCSGLPGCGNPRQP